MERVLICNFKMFRLFILYCRTVLSCVPFLAVSYVSKHDPCNKMLKMVTLMFRTWQIVLKYTDSNVYAGVELLYAEFLSVALPLCGDGLINHHHWWCYSTCFFFKTDPW